MARALLLACIWLCASPPGAVAKMRRFEIRGPGTLSIRSTKNKFRFKGRYRRRDGRYVGRALKRINRVFGARYGRPEARISLRLIERLAYLQKRLRGGWIVIGSGYRSPRYNRALRDKGRTVAKASLHQYGMALDLRLEGVKTEKVWRFCRKHRLGGAGYYGSPYMHLDTGPVRFWTQGTANVRKGTSDHNKRLILVPQYDRYRAGETMGLRFARMTAYPIGVSPRFVLERRAASKKKGGAKWQATPRKGLRLDLGQRGECPSFRDQDAMARVRWSIPADTRRGRYRIRVTFCKTKYEAMPKSITSYPFSLAARRP